VDHHTALCRRFCRFPRLHSRSLDIFLRFVLVGRTVLQVFRFLLVGRFGLWFALRSRCTVRVVSLRSTTFVRWSTPVDCACTFTHHLSTPLSFAHQHRTTTLTHTSRVSRRFVHSRPHCTIPFWSTVHAPVASVTTAGFLRLSFRWRFSRIVRCAVVPFTPFKGFVALWDVVPSISALSSRVLRICLSGSLLG